MMPRVLTSTGGPGQTTLPLLNRRSILAHAQPLIIELQDEPNSFVGYHNQCKSIKNRETPNAVGGATADPYMVATWRACLAVAVPELLVEMSHTYHTMTLFGSNNMMAIITNTLIITAAFSIATLPPTHNPFRQQSVGINIWVPTAQIFLFVFLIIQIAVPLNDSGMHIPANNALLFVVLYIATSLAIFAVSTPRDIALEANGPWVKTRYLGQRMLSNQQMAHLSTWRRTTPNGVAGPDNIAKGKLGSSHNMAEYGRGNGGVCTPLLESTEADIARTNASYGIGSANKLVRSSIGIKYTDMTGIVKFTSEKLVETNYVEIMLNHMSLVEFKFFEYSLTAGLFLVGTFLSISPNCDTYLLQAAYQVCVLSYYSLSLSLCAVTCH